MPSYNTITPKETELVEINTPSNSHFDSTDPKVTTKSIVVSSTSDEAPKYILRDILRLYMFDQEDSISLQLDFKRSVITPADKHYIASMIYSLTPDISIEDVIPKNILDGEVLSLRVDNDVLVITMLNYPLLDMDNIE